MKRVGNIFDWMCSEEVLKEAILNASKGKTKYGTVKNIVDNVDKYAKRLSKILLEGTFKPSPYTTEIIMSEGKQRLIKKLPFYPDRCVQHAMALAMLPKWDKVIGDDTFASWKGRGINAKDGKYSFVKRMKRYINSHHLDRELYCLKFDIRKCYQSVDNDILDRVNERYCKDRRLLDLMRVINHGDDERGLAIGNYISQLWINVYLADMDRFIKQELGCKQYVRYMDDCALLSESKEELHEWEHRIMNWLWYERGMELNGKRQVFPIGRHRGQRAIDMCGYCFYRTFTLLRKRIKQNIKRKLGNPKSMASYKGMLIACDSVNLVRSFNDEDIPGIGNREDKQAV